MAGNVRIRSRQFPDNVFGYWTVRPSNADTIMPQVWRELEDLQRGEYGMEWLVEVRGEDSDWHWHSGNPNS